MNTWSAHSCDAAMPSLVLLFAVPENREAECRAQHIAGTSSRDGQAARIEIDDLFGKGRRGIASVAVKYRDPANPENTWTGRGRMPRWMAAASKGGKAKKEDFLV